MYRNSASLGKRVVKLSRPRDISEYRVLKRVSGTGRRLISQTEIEW